jgi:hypothetical protein
MKLLFHQVDNISQRTYKGSRLRSVFVCPVCGWWKATGYADGDDFFYRGQSGYIEGAAASLRDMDLTDISSPITEVRSYLAAKYEKRFTLHPRLFEETVASVFGDIGYSAEATAYSGDDGIDVILKRGEETVGVQVKRYKNTIEVEQIRSLAGALILNGFTRGIFVTTSGFQSGGEPTTEKYKTRGYEIELLDATRFYDMLKIAQRKMYDSFEEFPVANVLSHLVKINEYTVVHEKIWSF